MSVNKVNNDGSLALVSGGTLYADAPVGSIQAYGGTTVPFGWLLCQGQAVSRATYAELFGVIGTSFGTGDGSTTFNIPDLRGEFLRGAGTNSHSGQGSGGSVGTHQDATQVPGIYLAGSGGTLVTPGVDSIFSGYDSAVAQTSGFKQLIMGAGASTNVPKTYATRPTNTSVNYIIKATTIALPSDFEAAVDEKIAALDVASVGGSGKYISAISEADGKISATATNLSTTPTNGSAVPITSGGVYAKFASLDTWTDVTSAAVNLTNVVAASTSIKVYSNGRQCKIIGEYVPTSAQAINDGWISSLTNISIKAGYRPKYETALAGFFAAHHHSPIVWYVLPNGNFTGYLGTANSETTSIARIPINGMWYIA